MNIFYLSYDQEECARWHVDSHVVKMILESTQLLSSAYYYTNQSSKAPYRLGWGNHPCSVWSRQSLDNWLWLLKLDACLSNEYTYRYGRIHACKCKMLQMCECIPDLPRIGFTQPPSVMPMACQISNDSAVNYQEYYKECKTGLFRWTKREEPCWIKGELL